MHSTHLLILATFQFGNTELISVANTAFTVDSIDLHHVIDTGDTGFAFDLVVIKSSGKKLERCD